VARLARTLMIAAALALTFRAAPAIAESAVHEHDGFYLRMGIGPGYVLGTTKPDGADTSAGVKGFDVSTELSFGGTIAPGFVLGGGSFSMIVPAPKYTPEGGSGSTVGTHHTSGIGPFVDFYPNPKEGVHVQAALLLSAIYIQKKDPFESASGAGFGGMVGGGYEVWVGEQWSIGPLIRFNYYNLKVEGSNTKVKSTLGMFVPSLLFAATYH
jgi:hypothetical protein